jgi:hypothetical protein
MLALFGEGRQAEALAAYQRTRGLVIEELGVEPGPGLRQLHQRILAGDALLAPGNGASPRAGHPTPRQLPARPVHFVGRSAQLRELTALLEQAASGDRTVIISAINGSAGVGKTALAMHWAHQVSDQFPDGQLYADLRGFDTSAPPLHPRDVLCGFLEALGYSPDQMPSALDSRAGLYRSVLADRRVLVVLDNARDAGQVRPLLPGSPGSLGGDHQPQHPGRAGGARRRPPACRRPSRRPGVQSASGPPARSRTGCRRTAGSGRAGRALRPAAAALAIAAARAASHPGFPLAALAAELRQAPARLDALNAGEPHADLRAVLSSSANALASQASEVFGLLGLAPGPDISLMAAASLIARPPIRTRALIRQLKTLTWRSSSYRAGTGCTTWSACMRPNTATTPIRRATAMQRWSG